MKSEVLLIVLLFSSPMAHCMEPKKDDFISSTQQWNGHHYHQNSTPQYQWAMKYLSRLDLTSYKNILDLGCGSGAVAATIADQVTSASILGVDASEDMIKKAQKEYSNRANLKFQTMDAQNLSFNNQFDLIISFATLHWIKNKQAVLNGIADALRPGGTALIVTAGKRPDAKTFLQLIIEAGHTPKWKTHFQGTHTDDYELDTTTFKKLIQHAELNAQSVEEIMVTRNFKTKEELTAWIKGWVGGIAPVAILPKEQQDELVKDAVHQYMSSLKQEQTIENQRPNLIARLTKPHLSKQ